jgi:hypothetical protein
MTAALAAVAAAAVLAAPPAVEQQRLPPLPARGLVRDTKAGIQLETLRGRPLALVRGLDLAVDKATSHGPLMRDRRGRLFAFDFYLHRVRQVFERPESVRGCRLTDARPQLSLLVCGHAVKTARYEGHGNTPRLRVVARAPGRIGHWVRAAFAPRGNVFFAQWSAECEIPVAFLIIDGVVRPFGGRTLRDAPASVALGWLPGGSAVVHFPQEACGGAFRTPGIYAVPRTGAPRLLLRTPRFAQYMMWGG